MNAMSAVSQAVQVTARSFVAKPVQIDAQKAKITVPQANPIMEDFANTAAKIEKNLAEVKESVSRLQKVAETMGTKVQFSVNKQLDRVVVSIIDPTTNKVIKQIPSEDIQRMQERIRQTIGLLFDEVV